MPMLFNTGELTALEEELSKTVISGKISVIYEPPIITLRFMIPGEPKRNVQKRYVLLNGHSADNIILNDFSFFVRRSLPSINRNTNGLTKS